MKIKYKNFINSKKNLSIFGINIYTDSIIDNFEIKILIDDYHSETHYKGIKVLKSKDVDFNDFFTIIASGGNTLSVISKLKLYDTIDFFTLKKYCNKDLIEVKMNEFFNLEYKNNKDKFDYTLSQLSDNKSKQIYSNIIKFRNSLDIKYLSNFVENQKNQYFDDIILSQNIDHFIDVGSFDGYTSLMFLEKFGFEKNVTIFEPDYKNYIFCNKKFKNNENVTIHNSGLGNFNKTLKFISNDSESKISEVGDIEIEINKLDDFNLQGRNSFLKIDIEGFEYDCLMGAKDFIIKNKPIIAVSIYHSPVDLWRIYFLIQSFYPQNNVYVRHYTETIYESVMFFIPNE